MPDFLKSDSQIEKYSEILILKLLNLVEHLSDTQDNFQRDKQQMLNSESNLHFFFYEVLLPCCLPYKVIFNRFYLKYQSSRI